MVVPAKSRERKCSTCKHYQPSPLWRKGWCRNPLLYDRNTNHLVEADSLACNRTFIDYWEPSDGPTPNMPPVQKGASQKSRPRIAPSVPLDTVDKEGNRRIAPGNTPAMGVPTVPPRQVLSLNPTPKQSPFTVLTHDDLDDTEEPMPPDPHATQQIEEVEGPAGQPAQRQPANRASVWSRRLPVLGLPLWPLLALLLLLGLAGGAYLMMRPKGGISNSSITPVPSITRALPTPTGFGDATATLPPQPTTPPTQPPPANVLAPGNFALVSGSKSGLSVRSQPTTKGTKLLVLADGKRVHIIGGPQAADGFNWFQVDQFDPSNPTATGWCVDKFLAPAPVQ